jgi:hypothetical protein
LEDPGVRIDDGKRSKQEGKGKCQMQGSCHEEVLPNSILRWDNFPHNPFEAIRVVGMTVVCQMMEGVIYGFRIDNRFRSHSVFFFNKQALLHCFVHPQNHSILGSAAKCKKPARLAQISYHRKAFLASLKLKRFLSAASCYSWFLIIRLLKLA